MPNKNPMTLSPRIHRPSLQRRLKHLVQSKASSAVIRGELTGQAAEGWHRLLNAAKPLGLTQEELLALLIGQAFDRLLHAIELEIECRGFDSEAPQPTEA